MKSILSSYNTEVKSIFKLSLPIMIAQVGTVLMGLSNSLMIAKIDKATFGGAGIINAIYVLLIVVGLGILSCVAPMVATAFATNNKERLGVLFRSSVEAAFLTSLILTAGMFIIAENLDFFPFSKDINLSKDYMRVLALSTFPYMFFMAIKQFSDGLTYTKPAVYITIFGVIFNVVFNWVLIFGNWGFPSLGVVGSGIATFLARTIMVIIMVGYILSNKNLHQYVPPLSANIHTDKHILRIFKIGIPAGMQLFFEMGAFTIASIMVGKLGATAAAANQIGMALASVSTMLATGISVASSIRVGKAVGEQNLINIKRTGTAAFLSAGFLMLVFCFVFILFHDNLVYLFEANVNDNELIYTAGKILIIVGFFQLSDGIQVTSLGVLRGISDVNIPTLITIIAYWAIGLPVSYLLGFNLNYGVEGIWYGLLVALTISAVLLTCRFYYLMNYKKQEMFFQL